MRHLLILLALAACTTAPVPSPSPSTPVGDALPTGMDDTCGAVRYHTLLQQDGTALERVLIMGEVRVIRPDSIVTQDYRPERMNFHIGTSGLIDRISCG